VGTYTLTATSGTLTAAAGLPKPLTTTGIRHETRGLRRRWRGPRGVALAATRLLSLRLSCAPHLFPVTRFAPTSPCALSRKEFPCRT